MTEEEEEATDVKDFQEFQLDDRILKVWFCSMSMCAAVYFRI